jgi:hypothetical protein
MKTRSGISPFLASVMLITITLMIGGVLFTQFRQTIVSQVRNPSLMLQDLNVASDGRTITVTIKNDGNVDVSLQGFTISQGTSNNVFQFSSGNATLVSSSAGGTAMKPGELLTARVRVTFSMPTFSQFTLTVIGDQLARAYNVQA